MNQTKTKVAVRRLRRSDLGRVARLHRAMFPASRSTNLGDLFVRRMYRWFLEKQSELALVATVEGEIAGIVTGAIGGYGRRITRYAAPQIGWCLMTQPRLVFNRQTFRAWTSYIQAFRPNYGAAKPAPPNADEAPRVRASVASIAVVRQYNGRGIGRALLEAFEDAAKQRGATQLGLSVEADNAAARRLYGNCGWQMTREDENDAYYSKDL